MKTIGLIGGMSWESSQLYYRLLNEHVRSRIGGLHSARCVLYSVDFAEIEHLQQTDNWEAAGRILSQAAQSLESAGAECIVLCTNTMHKLAGPIQAAVQIPFLHIADATGARIAAAGVATVGLLGTRFTMEEDFYKERLITKFQLKVLIPPPEQRQTVHDVIYQELCMGQINPESRERYRAIIAELVARGAQGIILGCTEIGLLVNREDSAVPLFDTTQIHAETAVEWSLSETKPD